MLLRLAKKGDSAAALLANKHSFTGTVARNFSTPLIVKTGQGSFFIFCSLSKLWHSDFSQHKLGISAYFMLLYFHYLVGEGIDF